MNHNQGLASSTSPTDELIKLFKYNLEMIDSRLTELVDFKLEIQRNNLLSLVKEARERIQQYEHIYPYLKELTKNQTINPLWYAEIEKVLRWALNKGRGKSKFLEKDIKNAWITYIVLLSCSMIDSEKPIKEIKPRGIFLKNKNGKIVGLMGSN